LTEEDPDDALTSSPVDSNLESLKKQEEEEEAEEVICMKRIKSV
jgi:hypothetical protein